MKRLFFLIMVCCLLPSVVTGHPNDAPINQQVDSIKSFFEIMDKSNPKISDIESIFGHHGDYEYAVLTRFFPEVDFSKRGWEKKFPRVDRFISDKLSHKESKSYFLQCIKLAKPEIFKNNQSFNTILPPKFIGPDSDREFVVQKGEDYLKFQFDSDETIINNIYFSKDRDIEWLFEKCSSLLKMNTELP